MADRIFGHAVEAFTFIETLDQLSTLQSVVDAILHPEAMPIKQCPMLVRKHGASA
jgi:hypothetical protein